MNFSIERSVLLDALSLALPIVEKRSPLPILSHVLVRASVQTHNANTAKENGAVELSPSHISIQSTNLSTTLCSSLPCNVIAGGAVAVPCKKLYEIVRSLTEPTVSIVLLPSRRVSIIHDAGVFELSTLPCEDFPSTISSPDIAESAVSATDILQMIDKTVFAVSHDEMRGALCGVAFESITDESGEALVAVALDSHRLGFITLRADLPLARTAVVPKHGLTQVRSLVSGNHENVMIGFDTKVLRVSSGQHSLTLRLMDTPYPPWRRVLPPHTGCVSFAARRITLLNAIHRVSLLTPTNNNGVRFTLENGSLALNSGHDLGSAMERLEITDITPHQDTDTDVTFVLNAVFVIDAIKSLTSDRINCAFYPELNMLLLFPETQGAFDSLDTSTQRTQFGMVMGMKV